MKKRGRETAFCWGSEIEREAYETAMPQAQTIIFQFPWPNSVIVVVFVLKKISVKLSAID